MIWQHSTRQVASMTVLNGLVPLDVHNHTIVYLSLTVGETYALLLTNRIL